MTTYDTWATQSDEHLLASNDPICDCGAILTTDDDEDPDGLICNSCYQLAMHEQWKEACEIEASWQR